MRVRSIPNGAASAAAARRRRLEQHAGMTLRTKLRQRRQPGHAIHRQPQRPKAHRPADQLQMRNKPASLPHAAADSRARRSDRLASRRILRATDLGTRPRATDKHPDDRRPGRRRLARILLRGGLRGIASRGTLPTRRDCRGLAGPEETRFGRRSGIPATRPNPRRPGIRLLIGSAAERSAVGPRFEFSNRLTGAASRAAACFP